MLPSFKLDYQTTRDLGFELESGVKWTDRLELGNWGL